MKFKKVVPTPAVAEKKPAAKRVVKKKTAPEPVVPYFIPGLPRDKGPHGFPANGNALANKKCEHIITVDAGTFRYLWEMVEANCTERHQKYVSIPNIARVCEEAVRAFRRSSQTDQTPKAKIKLRVKK